jgi:hypothetical protein
MVVKKAMTGSLSRVRCQGRQKAVYLELTALLIEREIARFRCGEQAALVSFTNVAILARNAGEELLAPRARARRNAPILPSRRHVSPQHSKPVMMNELRA